MIALKDVSFKSAAVANTFENVPPVAKWVSVSKINGTLSPPVTAVKLCFV